MNSNLGPAKPDSLENYTLPSRRNPAIIGTAYEGEACPSLRREELDVPPCGERGSASRVRNASVNPGKAVKRGTRGRHFIIGKRGFARPGGGGTAQAGVEICTAIMLPSRSVLIGCEAIPSPPSAPWPGET